MTADIPQSSVDKLREKINAIIEDATNHYDDGNDYDTPATDAIIAIVTAEIGAARIDELERSDYLINKNLGSQHAYKNRIAELRNHFGIGETE